MSIAILGAIAAVTALIAVIACDAARDALRQVRDLSAEVSRLRDSLADVGDHSAALERQFQAFEPDRRRLRQLTTDKAFGLRVVKGEKDGA